MDIIENLIKQGISESLIDDVLYYRNYYNLDKELEYRITKSKSYFYGKENDLQEEKLIYGNDFIYTKDIERFSDIVSMYLKKIIRN